MTDAADGYRAFYTEKLWELIPPYYRDLDGTSEPPGALRGLVEVIAEQAAILRRSQDRVWEDQFVERADDWAPLCVRPVRLSAGRSSAFVGFSPARG